MPHRDELFEYLKQKWNGYDKGAKGLFAKTKELLPEACKRAKNLNESSSPRSETQGYIAVVTLVERLLSLHKKYTCVPS